MSDEQPVTIFGRSFRLKKAAGRLMQANCGMIVLASVLHLMGLEILPVIVMCLVAAGLLVQLALGFLALFYEDKRAFGVGTILAAPALAVASMFPLLMIVGGGGGP